MNSLQTSTSKLQNSVEVSDKKESMLKSQENNNQPMETQINSDQNIKELGDTSELNYNNDNSENQSLLYTMKIERKKCMNSEEYKSDSDTSSNVSDLLDDSKNISNNSENNTQSSSGFVLEFKVSCSDTIAVCVSMILFSYVVFVNKQF